MENSNRLYEHCSYTPTSKKIRTRAKKCAKVKTVKIRQTSSGRKSASFTHLTLQPELGVTSCTREERFPWSTLHFTTNVSVVTSFRLNPNSAKPILSRIHLAIPSHTTITL